MKLYTTVLLSRGLTGMLKRCHGFTTAQQNFMYSVHVRRMPI